MTVTTSFAPTEIGWTMLIEPKQCNPMEVVFEIFDFVTDAVSLFEKGKDIVNKLR